MRGPQGSGDIASAVLKLGGHTAIKDAQICDIELTPWRHGVALRRALTSITQRHAGGQLAPSPKVGDRNGVADLMAVHDLVDILRAGYLPPIDTDNEVAAEI